MKKNILGLFIIGAVLLGTTATFAINNIMRNDDIGEITNYGLKNSRTIKTNIDLEQAKKIALDDAKAGKITSAELDRENGIWVFEIEVVDGNVEKDYKINADTGAIINVEVEKDRDLFVKNQAQSSTQTAVNKQDVKPIPKSEAKVDITVEKAKEIALKEAKTGSITKWELDRDYGILVYEVEVVDGNKEIDYKIDATTGKIIKTEVEVNGVKTKVTNQANTPTQANTQANASNGSKNTDAANTVNKANTAAASNTASNKASNNQANTKITLEKAKEIAMKQAKNGQITKIELDRENGVLVYEVEIRENKVEKEYKINAQTGEIVAFNEDFDDNRDDGYDHDDKHDDYDDRFDQDDHDDHDDDDDDNDGRD